MLREVYENAAATAIAAMTKSILFLTIEDTGPSICLYTQSFVTDIKRRIVQ